MRLTVGALFILAMAAPTVAEENGRLAAADSAHPALALAAKYSGPNSLANSTLIVVAPTMAPISAALVAAAAEQNGENSEAKPIVSAQH